MASLAPPPKLYTDDVSLTVIILDTNPFFWGTLSNTSASNFSFSKFLNHMIPFVNSLLLLNQLNHVVLIAAGVTSCGYIYDSATAVASDGGQKVPAVCSEILSCLEEFVAKDQKLGNGDLRTVGGVMSSLFSGALSLALCYIQRVFRSGMQHPQPRILCLQGSPDGPEQYVAVMNAIFSAQRSMVPIDSCVVGMQHSAFLQQVLMSSEIGKFCSVEKLLISPLVLIWIPYILDFFSIVPGCQASYITGGVYLKPQQLDGLFEYFTAVFATDLQSRSFLQLPRPVGVDFRASCFCHKKTIDMGYVCSVCLSIFCKPHKKCSTCGSDFSHSQNEQLDRKRKLSEA